MYKKYLVIFFLFAACYTAAQENVNSLNFLFSNGQVIWQKVYETRLSFEDFISSIEQSGIYESMEVSDSSVKGVLKIFDADFLGAGYKETGIPQYIPRNSIEGNLLIEYKPGRYRATLAKIILIQKFNDLMTDAGEEAGIEYYCLNRMKSGFSSTFLKTPIRIYEYSFDNLCRINEKSGDDDW